MAHGTDKHNNIEENSEDKANVRIPPPFIFLAGIGIGTAVHFFMAPRPAPNSWILLHLFCGVFLGLGGIAVIGLSYMHFRRTGQKPEPWKPTPSIIREGIYRYSRNPMYIGLALIQCGIGIGTDVLWITVMAIPVLIAIHYLCVLPEEKYLQRKFGEEYMSHKLSVRRWI